MSKVLIADKLPNDFYAPLFQAAGIEFLDGIPHSGLEGAIANCHGLIVRSETKVTAEILDKAPHLQIIGRAGTGYDNIDVGAATLKGIVVENTPDANSNSAAEHTMGLIYTLSRNISAANGAVKSGRWERSEYVGTEIKGKKLGIIGLGKVGELVAELGKGNKMEVVFYDPYISEQKARALGLTHLSLNNLLETSDYVTIHVPLTETTKGMIGIEQLTLMKPTAFLLNVARGGLVDEDALYEALESGKLAGAAFDVFSSEPYKGKLLGLRNFIATPHLGASTVEAQTRVAEEIVKQFIAYFQRGEIINGVNISPFSAEIKHYVGLVERMGYFAGKLLDGPINSVTVRCYGELGQANISGLATAALVGLLSEQIESLNLVNARQIAKRRGISLSEQTSTESIDYRNLISLEASVNGKEPVIIKGILYEKKGPRIVGLSGYDIEFEPSGILLVSSHDDVPGIVGKLGTTLGNYEVNIGTIDLSRGAKGGKAIAVLSIDSLVPPQVMREILDSGGFYNIQQITMPTKLPPRL